MVHLRARKNSQLAADDEGGIGQRVSLPIVRLMKFKSNSATEAMPHAMASPEDVHHVHWWSDWRPYCASGRPHTSASGRPPGLRDDASGLLALDLHAVVHELLPPG